MKRIFPLIIALLLLCGCQTKIYSPEIPEAFTQNATVTSGDFSYKCKICRKSDKSVNVEITSGRVKGLALTCYANEINVKSQNLSYSVSKDGASSLNIAAVLYDAFCCVENESAVKASKTDSGFVYKGKIPAGDFVLIQNPDNSYSSLSVSSAQIEILFAAN